MLPAMVYQNLVQRLGQFFVLTFEVPYRVYENLKKCNIGYPHEFQNSYNAIANIEAVTQKNKEFQATALLLH